MKKSEDNVTQLSDKDVRKLMKTVPWIGLGVSGFMAYLTLRALLTEKVEIGNSTFNQPYEILKEERSFDYIFLVSLFAVFFFLSVWYCVFRFRKRSKYRLEDGE